MRILASRSYVALLLAAVIPVAVSAQVRVEREGNGSVTSVPPGINCGGAAAATCHNTFPPGRGLRLHASPAPGWVFSGWSGQCTNTTGDCVFNVPAGAVTVGAKFTRKVRVKVNTVGAGGIAGPGILCNSQTGDCAEDYPAGTSVTLNAIAQPGGNAFISWAGVSCAAGPSNPVCAFTVNSPVTATAKFRLPTLRVTISGDASGRVSYPSPIYGSGPVLCAQKRSRRGEISRTKCNVETYPPGTAVTISARGVTPPGKTGVRITFTGTSGCPSGNGTLTCTVTMTGPVRMNVDLTAF